MAIDKVRFINIIDIMHPIEHYYITSYRSYTMHLTFGLQCLQFGIELVTYICLYNT